ncbi:MAG: hypothetical protein WA418_18640, partial [Bradyrhizobium sp.]
MAAFLDICRFLPTAGGTTDWIYAAAVQGYQSPTAAGAANGRLYKYRAESADLTQWEVGEGAYTASTGTLARTSILFTSAGTTAKVSFSAAPQVAIVALKEDLISIEEANGFTTTQQAQARTNIAAAATPANSTRTVLTSGSGTYTAKSGCKALLVRMVGGGGGGGGGGGSPTGGTGGNGGATTFGTSFLVANGGGGNGGGGFGRTTPATASGGDLNVSGQGGPSSWGAGGTSSVVQGVSGGASLFGGNGNGGWPGAVGEAAAANTGSGGGGGGGSANGNSGAGGGAGAHCEKFIALPAASYAYAVGSGGAGGAAGGGSNASA